MHGMPRAGHGRRCPRIGAYGLFALVWSLTSSGCALSRSGDEDSRTLPEGRALDDQPLPEGRALEGGDREDDTPEGRAAPEDATITRAETEAEPTPTDTTTAETTLDSQSSAPSILGDEAPTPIDDPEAELLAETDTVGRSRVTLAPELEPLERPRWIKHHRAPRETLRQIAIRHGVSERKLREWNGLGPDDPAPQRRKRIRVYAQRVPPPRQQVEHTVAQGDTWWSVALRYGVEPRDLRVYNWPWKKKMQPGTTLEVWIDPVVYEWIAEGPDPHPLDLDHRWRRGAISIGSPNDGILVNGLRIPEAEGVVLRLPRTAYGTSHAVEQLLLALERFRERTDYPPEIPVGLGSMSASRGGRIGTHVSHQSGRDIDIRLLRRPDVPAWRQIRGSRAQWSAVWDLVMAFSEVDATVIFLDQRAQRRLFRAAKERGATPEQLALARRLVQHSPGHEDHLHVRFGCGPYEPECIP